MPAYLDDRDRRRDTPEVVGFGLYGKAASTLFEMGFMGRDSLFDVIYLAAKRRQKNNDLSTSPLSVRQP